MEWSSSSLYECMATRRSVRRFKEESVPHELVERLIEAAITAPSASNKQPWRFWLITDRETIAKLAAAVREVVDRIVEHIEPSSQGVFRAYGDYFTRFETAPLVIVPLFKSLGLLSHLVNEELPETLRKTIVAMERDSALVSTSLAIQNLQLMAPELGLGTSVMTGPLLAMEPAREILHIKPSWYPVAFIAAGYPDETPLTTSRKEARHVMRWIDERR